MSKGETKVIPLASDEQKIRNKLQDLVNYIDRETRELRGQGIIFEAGFQNVQIASPIDGSPKKVSKSFFMEAVIIESKNSSKSIAIRS